MHYVCYLHSTGMESALFISSKHFLYSECNLFVSSVFITTTYALTSSHLQFHLFCEQIMIELKFFRLIACVMPDIDAATPVAGVVPVILVLFSGYIQSYNNISYGWTWFYWLNPIAWTLKALSVNEYTSAKYDFPYCLDDACMESTRFGDNYLNSKGNPTDRKWIWYSFAVLVAEYVLFIVLSAISLKYLQLTPAPPPPITIPSDVLLMSQHEGNNFNCKEEEKIWNEEEVDAGMRKDPGAEAVMNLSEYDEEVGTWVESRPMEDIKMLGDGNSKSPMIDRIPGVENRRISQERGGALEFNREESSSTNDDGDLVHDHSEEMIAIKEIRKTRKASMCNVSMGPMIDDIPLEPVSFAFKDLCYSVVLPGGHELELLRNVTGFFEPGTVTALMGSSGAGKTTLLDVLSGRKTSGVVKGGIFVNGYPKSEKHFRRNMGYVEQFDSLSPRDTAKEAITFSAALRLPNGTTKDQRNNWVDTILIMLELTPLVNVMVGSQDSGGMSFEQKKRLSIGVELAANPSILFLDEPTTGISNTFKIVLKLRADFLSLVLWFILVYFFALRRIILTSNLFQSFLFFCIFSNKLN